MAQLVPAVYKCRQHDLVLTDDVRAEIEANPVKALGSGMLGGPSSRPRSFRVIVRCPDGDGGHQLVFRGTYQR